MGSVYARKDSAHLWWSYRDAHGKRIARASPFKVGQEPKAKAALRQIEQAIAGMTEAAAPQGSGMTVAQYAERWLTERKARGVRDIATERSRIRLHVLPQIGALALGTVKPVMIKAMVATWRQALAPRTVRNVFTLVRGIFADALDEELVDKDPTAIHAKYLGEAGDADPEWRATAIYSREEVDMLMTDPRIPVDRRVLYAVTYLGGLRLGEAAGLRWRHLQAAAPLDRLLIALSYDGRTKTDQPRAVPVHPVLARVLQLWRSQIYAEVIGHEPEADDLVIPSAESLGGNGSHKHRAAGTMRTKNQVGKRFTRDLAVLELRHRRFHDLRRTFISLAQADGANPGHLESVTHTPASRKAFDLYTSIPWSSKCAAVAALRIAGDDDPEDLASRVLRSCYADENGPVAGATRPFLVEAPGVEPGSEGLRKGLLRV